MVLNSLTKLKNGLATLICVYITGRNYKGILKKLNLTLRLFKYDFATNH